MEIYIIAANVVVLALSIVIMRKSLLVKLTKRHQQALKQIEQEKLAELEQMKREVFSNISHEFRTPLTLIKGPLEYLQKKGASIEQDKVDEHYRLIHRNTVHLLGLVDRLLDSKKLEEGKMRLSVSEGDLAHLLEEVTHTMPSKQSQQNVKTVFTPPTTALGEVWFDALAVTKITQGMMAHVFRQAPPNGRLVVSVSDAGMVSLKKGAPGVDCVQILVTAYPPPLSENRGDDVFGRLRAVAKSSKAESMELVFARKMVKLHKGTIESVAQQKGIVQYVARLPKQAQAYSQEEKVTPLGQGICPVHDTDDDGSGAAQPPVAMTTTKVLKTNAQKPKVLIVDDNQDIHLYLKNALSDNYCVYCATNGVEGLAMASDIKPDIVLADLKMPEMDGITLCSKLKEDPATNHIPVVMITAKASYESEVEGLKIGADDYIRKPFELDLLQIKIDNIIKLRKELKKHYVNEIKLQPKEVPASSADEQFITQAMGIVEKHMMNTNFNVEMMVEEMGLSRSNLYLKLKELTGMSSSEFVRNIRLKRAVQLLESSDHSVKEIMYMTGFNTASYFSKCFKKQYGVIPSEYGRKATTAL